MTNNLKILFSVSLHKGHGPGEGQAADHQLRRQDQPRGRAQGLRQSHPGRIEPGGHPGSESAAFSR